MYLFGIVLKEMGLEAMRSGQRNQRDSRDRDSSNAGRTTEEHGRGRSYFAPWIYAGALALALPVAASAQDSAAKPATPAENTQPVASQEAASPAVAQTTPKGLPGVDNARYVIGPEDSLSITVWKEPTLSGTIPVRPDGMISMALLGDIQASGRTPMQLADDVTARLKKYVQDPNVSIVVMGVNSKRIYLIGEVGHAGPVPMTPDMTALQAVATGGGLSPYANAKKIYILRIEGGKQQKIPFNYKQALKGDESQNLVLKPGDTIIVP